MPPPIAPSGITWSWPRAFLGLAVGLPAAVVVLVDVQLGLALAVGVMPAATVAVSPRRRGRIITAVVGAVAGACMIAGAVLAEVPVLAVTGIVVLSLGAAWWATRGRAGMLAMGLGLPLVGVGLSFSDLGVAVGLGSLMVVGAVWAWLVSLLWPETEAVPPPAPRLPVRAALVYGCLLGAAGGIAATIGFAADLEHVGWATAAVLLVMRPGREALVLRSVGRACSVVTGALLGGLFMASGPAVGLVAAAVLVALVGLSATQPSRWYVAPAFTTFIVFVLLLRESPSDAGQRFGERTVETLLGVGLALFFGAVVPMVLQRRRSRSARPEAAAQST